MLKGSLIFVADLMRAIPSNVVIDLMEVSSYGGGNTESSGTVRILKDLSGTIEGRDVLIVEDINDTGETLIWIQNQIRAYQPDADRNVRYAALMDNTPSKFTDLNYSAETINKDLDPAWIVFPWEK